jgi:flagellar protein FlaF
MSVHAYQTAAAQGESPRDMEYRLFGQVTRSLIDASGPAAELPELAAALAWNRQVWSAMASDCADERNSLPDQLRAGIISLALFVRKYSSAVLRDGAEVSPLIDINRTIMQGLEQRVSAA